MRNTRVSVKDASILTGLSLLTIRKGIEFGELPIGSAIHTSNSRTTYHIVPIKLAEYIGVNLDELNDILNNMKG